MRKIEHWDSGDTINAEEALQYIIGETYVKKDKFSDYKLEFIDDGEEIQITVDQINNNNTANCLFNEIYQTDSYAENTFSFEQLIDDLHVQHLEIVENWLADHLIKNYTADEEEQYNSFNI
jgi:hypothetical protein